MTETPPRISPLVLLILRPIHWFLMTFYFRVTIRHAERLPQDVPIILAPTHRSMLDSLFLAKLLGRQPYYLANRLNYRGLQGWMMRKMGCISLNLAHPSHQVMKQCTMLVQAGQPLVMFPEATIYYYPPDQVHVPLAPGVAWLSLNVALEIAPRAPVIVPIRLNYSDLQLRFRSRIEVIVQSPIDVAPFMALPKKAAREQLTDLIRTQLGDHPNASTREEFPATEFLEENRRMLRSQKNFCCEE